MFWHIAGNTSMMETVTSVESIYTERALKILVVDDEEDLLPLLVRILETNGCEVTTAQGVADARRAALLQEFDVLVTDVDMPGGPVGLVLARELLAAHPKMRIVLMSGTPRDAIVSTGFPMLQKPFSARTLVDAVRGRDGTTCR